MTERRASVAQRRPPGSKPAVSKRRYTSSDTSAYRGDFENFRTTDTVIVGNGPAALFLSYLLHGNVPKYDMSVHGPHPDPVLHAKLQKFAARPLYEALDSPKAIDHLTEHFPNANLSYSSQALPVNALLDALVRPNADVDIGETKTRLRWDKEPGKRVDHMVVGCAPEAGGQWTEDPISTNWDIGTLSYAEMFSLPGYSFPEHYKRIYKTPMPDLIRPTRRDVSSYYATYPRAVGIASQVFSATYARHITRNARGFTVRVHRRKSGENFIIACRHLVLATGIFSHTIPAPPIFMPLNAAVQRPPNLPLLVVGSGFTAADVILSQPPDRRIIHIYRWDSARPSPLKGCHPQAYPEYAEIYQQMKRRAGTAAAVSQQRRGGQQQLRDWERTYEGFPNASVINVCPNGTIDVLTVDGERLRRQVDGLKYCVGRRGSLEYLCPEMRREVGVADAAWVSADTLRRRVESDIEVAQGVFAVGSLTGDSLVRYGFGGCMIAAGRILGERGKGVEGGGIDRGVGVVVTEKRRSSWVGGGACVVS